MKKQSSTSTTSTNRNGRSTAPKAQPAAATLSVSVTIDDDVLDIKKGDTLTLSDECPVAGRLCAIEYKTGATFIRRFLGMDRGHIIAQSQHGAELYQEKNVVRILPAKALIRHW